MAALRGRVGPVPAADARRSTASRCSIASARSKPSSSSCTAPSPARRASRSKGSTCSSRCSTWSSRTRPTDGISNVLIGMAHRGRLNVLAHVLSKPYAQILAEFKDPVHDARRRIAIDLGWAGDVKYHAGARAQPEEPHGVDGAEPEPSRVREPGGRRHGARRRDARSIGPGPVRFDSGRTLPVLIHGDAAFPGQGIVTETLNLARLDGYDTGGTIHIIVNNQLGFTATSKESYGTSYSSGVARGYKIPIIHVNADDPERVHRGGAAGLGLSRALPPRRADRSRRLPSLRPQRGRRAELHAAAALRDASRRIRRCAKIWADRLVARGTVTPDEAEAMLRQHFKVLEDALASLRPEADLVEPIPEPPPPGAARQVSTAVTRRAPACAERGAARAARRLHAASQARSRARAPPGDARRARRAHASTGRPPRSWPSPRFSRTASRFASPARTSAAAPSAIVTRSSTT